MIKIGLNNNTKGLLRSVADNDLQKAKAYAKIIISNDTSASNKSFCNQIKTKLEAPSANMLEIPSDLKLLLRMEDVSVTFNEARYYLTDRERVIFENIHTANKVNSQLAEMGIRYLNSTLLYGESGTGKTTLGKYVAYKLGVPFAYMNFAHCISSYLGTTAKNIEKVFDYVKKQKCVLMLDEVDAIGLKRGTQDVGEMSRIVIGLMQSLDLLENEVVVIGATNRLDTIDDALIRRFSLKHEVETFNSDEVVALIKMFLADIDVTYNEFNIVEYSKSHNKQSEIINDITLAIIVMLRDGVNFVL